MLQFNTPSPGRVLVLAAALVLAALAGLHGPAAAQSQRVLVVVGDQPITDYDVSQRLRLNEVLGYPVEGTEAKRRKDMLEELIDEEVKQIEAKKNKILPTDKQVDEAIERMAKRTGSTREGLEAKLKSKGVNMQTLRTQVAASLSFNWLMSGKYSIDVKVDPAEVDRRYSAITTDPRLKPVAVYQLLEISLPVDSTSEANAEQVLYARAIEAQQIMQRFKGCAGAHAAVAGIYNVKLSKTIEAPVDQVPAQMKAALDKAGPGHIIGPMRSKQGVQLIAYCSRATMAPPKPSRDVVENILLNEKYKVASERIMRDLRRGVFIDYKTQQ